MCGEWNGTDYILSVAAIFSTFALFVLNPDINSRARDLGFLAMYDQV